MTQNTSAVRAIAIVISLAFLGTAMPAWCADPAPAARLPVPADGDIAQWRKKIRDAYEVEYKAAKESGEPATLLDKLRKDVDSAPEPAKMYAFLLEAEDVAAQHDDAAATLALVDRRAELFAIDCLAERSKTLARLAGPKIAADLTLLEQATATATKAAAAERFDIATESTALAIKIAQSIDREQKAAARRRQQRKPAPDEVVPVANGVALIKSALDLQKRIVRRKDLFTASEEAKAVLAKQPDDPAANAAVGTYLCFVAQNWAQGLPHLKKSGLPTLGESATEELALGDPASADAAKVFPLAGKWWEAAEAKTLADDERMAVRDHASRLYGSVRTRLTDPLEIRVADIRGGKYAQPAATQITATQQLENSIGMKLALIPAGTFQMGSDEGEPNERPVHEVRITKPFYLGIYEVTNAQWKSVMGDVPSKWGAANRPVEQVSWDDAVEFCRKLSERQDEQVAGRVFRLPTEAEWEYACRAGARTQFSFGNDVAIIDEYAWHHNNANGTTHLVGLKKANAWGLHDMHGNVWEWCRDWKGDYSNDGATDPEGPPTGVERIWRGGARGNTPQHCRSAMRGGNPPSARFDYLGFRVAMDSSGSTSPKSPGRDTLSPGPVTAYTLARDFVYANGDLGIVINKHVGKETSVSIPPKIDGLPVTTVGNDAFNHRSDLTEIVMPSGIVVIGNAAFCGCARLTELEIPPTVRTIGFNAFQECHGLRCIFIPASVVELGAVTFNNSLSLTEITVAPQNPNYASVDGVLYDKAVKTLISCPTGKEGDLVLPESVQRLSSWSFQNCKKLRSVTVPKHTVVEPEAFNGCPAEIRR